jgi:hypothetical protein
MKISKKIWAGFSVFTLLLFGLVLFSHKVSALTTAQLDSATYTDKFVGGDLITGSVAGAVINFKDNNIIGEPHNYKPQSGAFCDGTTYGHNSQADENKGITLTDAAFDASKNGAASFTASINFDYLDSGVCKNYQSTIAFIKQADGSYLGKVAQVGDVCDPNNSNPSGFNCVCSSQVLMILLAI